MRVYDWESGNIVGMVSNLPTTIMSGAMAKSSNLFSFGCADSKVRIFNIEAHSNGRPFWYIWLWLNFLLIILLNFKQIMSDS